MSKCHFITCTRHSTAVRAFSINTGFITNRNDTQSVLWMCCRNTARCCQALKVRMVRVIRVWNSLCLVAFITGQTAADLFHSHISESLSLQLQLTLNLSTGLQTRQWDSPGSHLPRLLTLFLQLINSINSKTVLLPEAFPGVFLSLRGWTVLCPFWVELLCLLYYNLSLSFTIFNSFALFLSPKRHRSYQRALL